MKIKIWNAVTDGGDGEHHAHQFPSFEALKAALNLENDADENGGMDEYGYWVDISTSIFDTTGYEIVEG